MRRSIGDTLTGRYPVEEIDLVTARSPKVEVMSTGEVCMAGVHVMKWVVSR